MPKLIDLSLAIEDHFRWSVTIERKQAFDRGDVFQTSSMRLSCHAYTHVDAPVHFVPGAATLGELPADHFSGPAVVLDLSHVGPNHGIGVVDLEQQATPVEPGDIVLLKTGWDHQRGIDSPDFWLEAPYVTRPAAEWLLDARARCVGYDFPPDFCIRDEMKGRKPRRDEFVTHDVFLTNGVGVVEYLCNLDQLPSSRVFLVVAPMKLGDVDGAPARVFAIEWEADRAPME